ncbi:MAG: polysulfide reductase NrfD [Acidobacteria bacterium]|nr:polysulfide reductase NrfD [Acidobacteriota bacterium]
MSVTTTALARPAAPRPWTFHMTSFRVVLLGIAGLGIGSVLYRFLFGLSASTNLTDQWPWGLWIWWDVAAGAALAGGGYSTALMVNFLGGDKWRTVERGAFLTSMLGYVMVSGGLLLDLGRWFNFWRPIRFWGYHSVMFLLFWCVAGYTVVQLVEFGHIWVERVPTPRMTRLMHRIYVPVLIVGVVLPILHQSALGSLFIVAKGRLDPLWWSMLLPLFFLMSSFFVGPAMVAIENIVSARAHGRRAPVPVLGDMVRVTGKLMGVYLVLKIADLVWRGELGRMFEGTTASNFFLIEMLIGIVVPGAMFLLPRIRQTVGGLFAASFLVVAGVVFNRANVVFTGMARSVNAPSYFPYWMELAVTGGLIAGAVLTYLFITENFPILPERGAAPSPAPGSARAAG